MPRLVGNLLRDRRGSVAVIAAIMAPVMIVLMIITIEVTAWSLTKMELQRMADAAAWAGALQYVATNDPQTATLSAVQMAEINSIPSSAQPSWDSTTLTTTNGLTTASMIQGSSGTTLTAIVRQNVDKSLSLTLSGSNSLIVISATSTIQITSNAVEPPKCLSALGGGSTSISLSGSSLIKGGGCSIRANGGITLSGSAILDVGGTYSVGPVQTSGTSYVAGGETTLADPASDSYANYAPLVKAFGLLSSGGTTETLGLDNQTSIGPGTYSSITVSQSAILTMQPGLYIVNGDINVSYSAQLQGTGVTIVSSGSLNVIGSAIIALSPPDANSSTGGVPGFVFASKSTVTSNFGGSSSLPYGGIIYYPDGDMALSGSFTSGANGCTQFLANELTLSDSANITTDCSNVTSEGGSASSTPSIALSK